MLLDNEIMYSKSGMINVTKAEKSSKENIDLQRMYCEELNFWGVKFVATKTINNTFWHLPDIFRFPFFALGNSVMQV